MQVLETVQSTQKNSAEWRHAGHRIGFVPTMGFLHEGHLRLIDEAKRLTDKVIVSIFVNPTQFGPLEDFGKYPRDLDRDLERCEKRGVDVVFVPEAIEMYGPGDQTQVIVTELTRGLCGPFRPGHFRGVGTVVAKLFLITQPNVAVFGEKDYQQLKVIQRMVKDLRFPVEVIGVPTVREPDGLAMSSRNTYLNEEERKEALRLYQGMMLAQELAESGETNVVKLVEKAKFHLTRTRQIDVEYVELVDPETLLPLKVLNKPGRMILAVHLNKKRLIDNAPIFPKT